MNHTYRIQQKILDRKGLVQKVEEWKTLGRKVVFTNGCFDILHKGHLEILNRSAELGDVLVVALNADASVKRLKGNQRPVNNEAFRSQMMASLEIVDAVTIFDEETPSELIRAITPDVMVKGGDYTVDQVVGADHVISHGGEVRIIPFIQGYSTTGIIAAIQSL
jgi:D-beta-D-heptose 7-phosphate kinase/D-beta-D-heptose 1-phosphate adenosyltransferase